MTAAIILAAAALATPVRDPFWPVGYEGRRQVISAEPRGVKAKVEPKAAEKAAEAEKPKAPPPVEATDEQWRGALKSVRFGGTMRLKGAAGEERAAMLVNGKARTAGAVVRSDFEGWRFVWRIESDGDGRRLRLKRLKAVKKEAVKGESK